MLVISVYNMRSIWPKFHNLAELRGTDLCFLTEIWEKLENKKYQRRIMEMMELQGIHYISTPRPGSRRGGGVAIAFPGSKFHVTKLNIDVPKPLECIFALVKPVNPTGKTNIFIAICFYSPPRSTKTAELSDLIWSTVARLRTQYSRCGLLL